MKKTLLCILMIVATIAVFYSSLTAYASEDYVESTTVLSNLGVLKATPNMEVLKDGMVTKIEAVELLNTAFGPRTETTAEQKTVFSDIPADSTYFASIAVANQLGIVKATDGVNFSPMDPITTDEFSRMLIRAVGYERKAEKYNYSLSGYTTVALSLDILDRSDLSDDGYISMGQAYNAVYNALFLNPVISYNANNNLNVYVDDSTTILENNFGYKSVEGLYYANKYSSLYSTDGLKDDQFAVKGNDGSNYVFTSTDTDYRYLGYNVKVFYSENGQSNKALCLIKYDNKELVIDGSKFDYFNVSDRKICYHEDEMINSFTINKKNKEVKISNSDLDFIYNGQYTADATAVVDILNNSGKTNGYDIESIVLVDNDGDSKYEIVLVNAYKDFFVSYLNSNNESVSNPDGETIKYDEDDYFIINTDKGNPTVFSKIEKNNVLRVKEGMGNPKLYDITVSSTSIYARVHSKSVENDKTILELEEGEQTSRGSGFIGSMVGGTDNEIPIARYGVAASFESHVDELLLTSYSLYNIYLNADNEVAGYSVFTYDKNSGILGVDNPVGANTYTSANFGVMLAVSKESSLKDIVRVKIYDKPQEARTMAVRDFNTTEDFKIKDIKDSCLFIENPSDFYVSEVDGTVQQDKVDLYYRLQDEYQKYGEDGSKYSLDVLKFIFGNKLVTYKADENYAIYEIQLPVYGKKEGRLAYMTVPGQSYYKKSGTFYSLYDGSQVFATSKNLSFFLPDPDCSYANCFDLCTNGTYDSYQDDEIIKMDFYTFTDDSPVAQFTVRFIDYDAVSVNQGSSSVGIVTKKTKGGSAFGYPVDNYYLMGDTLTTDWGYKRYYCIYPKTYNITETKVMNFGNMHYKYVNEATGIANLSIYTKKISDMTAADVLDDIEPGDFIAVYYPSYTFNTTGYSPFTAAHRIYDYSEDKVNGGSYSSDSTNFGDREYTMGKIFKIDDYSVALLPWYYENKEGYKPEINDCFIAKAEKISVMKCVTLKDGTFKVTRGETADLYDALINNTRVVAEINSANSSPTATNSVFYLYINE